ncbi:MAG TPA: type II toxin-antitoxin system HicA family toxin [Anaerolineae bacterium]|nr:type II toxin-antitoxin system HicA family toxin [Anaerolineae bacterium]HOR00304.1 type II toxin-antitoxin system HicA family toxin [Anaerolineae bacterium]HPL29886.1 type II toxin-antitoxin system HicA family toxin [Anaerolineae bacterium]
MTHRRRFSSDEVVSALLRAGFEARRKPKGSHLTLTKLRPDGRGHYTATVVLGRHEIKDPTLDGILEQAHLSYEELLEFAKVKK